MDKNTFVEQHELNDPALERLINIYYFLKEGNDVRNARLPDFGLMRTLLEDAFPKKFSNHDICGYTPEMISKIFCRFYNFYHKKYDYMLEL